MGRPPAPKLEADLVAVLKIIGASIYEFRMKQKFTQAELARRSGISLTTINELEKRRFRDIRVSTLVSIARVLNVPVGALFRGSDLKIASADRARLLRASEDLLLITQKMSRED